MSYSERLGEAMTAAGVDRKALSAALKISVQAVGQVLNGKTKALDAANHMRAARLLRCDPHWLATGERMAQGAWPFGRVTPEVWEQIPPALKDRIEAFIEGTIAASIPPQSSSGNQATGT